MKSTCQSCNNEITDRHHLAKVCLTCLYKKVTNQKKAIALVAKAVKKGNLQPAKSYKCVDCGVDAFCYDHRDYGKPFEVVPVCRKCNFKRGFGKITNPI